MNFSIIIPTHNRSRQLLRLLTQLSKQHDKRRNVDIHVVLSNCEDDSFTAVKKHQSKTRDTIHTWIEPKGNPSVARNIGFAQAKYNHIIFLDDDIEIPLDFLNKIDKTWRTYPFAFIIGCKIKARCVDAPALSLVQQDFIQKHAWCFGQQDLGDNVKLLSKGEMVFSGAMSCRKNAFHDEVLFDPMFGMYVSDGMRFGGEDYELCVRVNLQGGRIYYDPSVVVYNFFKQNRINSSYVSRRYFFAGLERYLIDKKMINLFVQKHRTYKQECLYGFKEFLKGSWRSIISIFSSKYEFLTFFSYFFCGKYFYY